MHKLSITEIARIDRNHNKQEVLFSLRDWSLITGRGGGGLQNGRGACELLPLGKGGGAKKL